MKIGELSSRTGTSARSLRYYEEQGLLAPTRSSTGQRIYQDLDVAAVVQIRALFEAGFCSAVIRELAPALACPTRSGDELRDAVAAAHARLSAERDAIEAEMTALTRLASSWGLDPHTSVSPHAEGHDD